MKERREEYKQQCKEEQKRINEKEIAAILRTVIALNEDDRKSKHRGYIELSRSNDVAIERARDGKESYQKALQANKQNIEKKLEKRPTLIRRYQEVSCCRHHHLPCIFFYITLTLSLTDWPTVCMTG